MARGTTLSTLTEMVQDECRTSSATSRGLDYRPYLQRLIKRVQTMLYDDYTWSFLKVKRGDAGKLMAAGQRYYDFPTALNAERIDKVWLNFNGIWVELVQGIDASTYNAFDSDLGVRSDPQIKWDYYDETQFEVWPMPASNGAEVRFEGIRALTPLVAEDDTAMLDDVLISLFCAAEVLARNNAKDGQMKLSAAQARLLTLNANLSSKNTVVFGQGSQHRHGRRETTLRVVKAAI